MFNIFQIQLANSFLFFYFVLTFVRAYNISDAMFGSLVRIQFGASPSGLILFEYGF